MVAERAPTASSSSPLSLAVSGAPRVYAHGGFRVDLSNHPVVCVRFPAQVEREAYEWLFDLYARLANQTEAPIAWLVELDDYDALGNTAAQRRDAAQIFDSHREEIARGTLCEARVVSRSLPRNILTAFDWLTASAWPRRNFASHDEAIAWMQSLRDRP